MGVDELLRRVVGVLERLDLPYLVTGSMATILYGEPRFTNDVDVVVDLPAERSREFCAAFPAEDFYVDPESVRRAIERSGQFNIIHPRSGLKVDVIIPERTAFDESRFARGRRERPAGDYEATFASPEDAILKKLEYFREGGSDKHLRDVVGVLEVSGEEIDRAYIREWAERLELVEIWEAVFGRLREG